MTTNPAAVILVTILLIGLSAFFVAIEFALIAAKRYRLEDAAETSRAGRAALRNSAELTLLLAGSQLGITGCTLLLGAVTKPAFDQWLTDGFQDLGIPEVAADVSAFAAALLLVTFLHLVIGEMAPKSWAIAHPERSAMLLAIPMRGFMFLTRPLLRSLNSSANWLVRRVGVEPTETLINAQNAQDLQQLVRHSVNVGALDARYASQLEGALRLEDLTVGSLVNTRRSPTRVTRSATIDDVHEASRLSGHLRILLGNDDEIYGVVHVRDTLTSPLDAPAAVLARPVFQLDKETSLYETLATMRRTQQHLIVVTDRGRPAGVVTLADVLGQLLPSATR